MGKWRNKDVPPAATPPPASGGKKKKPPAGDDKPPAGGAGPYARPDNGYNPAGTRDRYNDLIDRGIDASNSDRLQVGDDYTKRLLGSTNFDGQNDYLSSLWNELGGTSFDEGIDLLKGFLGGKYGGSGGSSGGGSAPQYMADGTRVATGGSFGGNYASRGPGGAAGAGSSGGGVIPDTMAQGGWVADRIRELFDPARLDPKNDPTMQPYLDSLREQSMEAWAKEKASLDASAEGRGRYGGGLYSAMSGDLSARTAKELDRATAAALFGSREAALARQMEGLGTANQRDLAAMQDATQRYGIDSAASSSSAASSAAAESAARGQDLAAIGQLLNMQQFGLGMKQGIGNFFGQMQQGALGNIAGMQGASNQGLGIGIQGANGLAGLDLGLAGLDIQKLMSQNQLKGSLASSNAARAGVNLQGRMWDEGAQQREIDNLLKIIMGVGGMGNTQTGGGGAPYPGGSGMDAILRALAGGG